LFRATLVVFLVQKEGEEKKEGYFFINKTIVVSVEKIIFTKKQR
jgi:hypothetical protein